MALKILLFSAFLSTLSLKLIAQEGYLPLNRDVEKWYDSGLNEVESDFHSAIKPYRISEVKQFVDIESVNNSFYFNTEKSRGLILRKIRKENFLKVDADSGNFHISLDPLFNFEGGSDFASHKNTLVNTRGASISGTIGKKFSFYSSFYENQAIFVGYIDKRIRSSKVVPGQGYIKNFDIGGTNKGFDYNMATAYISYTPSRYFNLQFGHDKNFIGDGYRSLFLSDNAFNYPFLKITTNVWKLKYEVLYTSFLDASNFGNFNTVGFPKKYSTMHFLSWNVFKRLNIGFFESIVWRGADSTGNRGFDVNYLNPVIFLRPVEFYQGSSDNALMGFSMKFKLANHTHIYGQLLLDELKIKEVLSGKGWYSNKQGLQAGLKSMDIFNIDNLNFQGELNFVRPYTYSHYNVLQNYGHDNQALAHPLGANFAEALGFLNYRYKSFFAEVHLSFAFYGADTTDSKGKTINFGQNIYLDYLNHPKTYGNYVGQGLKTTLLYKDFRIAYIINPNTNLNIEAGFSLRTQSDKKNGTQQTNYVFVGIRTSLNNHYYDF